MDFILKSLSRKIQVVAAQGNQAALSVHCQARYEYMLMLMLGYLWNRNYNNLTTESKEYISSNIIKPSVGTIISLIRRMDVDKEFFGNKKMRKSLENYPSFRNEKLGHGYTFEDGIEELIKLLNELQDGLLDSGVPFLSGNIDLITVDEISNGMAVGIIYKSNGSDYFPWNCSLEVYEFAKTGLYGYNESIGYFRLSPFVVIKDEGEYYIFSSIQEKLSGLSRYNKLIKTGDELFEISDFSNIVVEIDSKKYRSGNGTVLNVFNKNYKKYIETGVKGKIEKFLLESKSSVFATVWGHGGVGKTASIQSLCEDLANAERKKFDYIIFLSAKDRYYNYFKGNINEVDNEKVDSMESIAQYVNDIMFGAPSSEIDDIIKFEGKLLLIIDDFETFSLIEQSKVLDFIKKLNINFHKVIITTRAATLIMGEEIKTNELDEKEMIEFLLEVVAVEAPTIRPEALIKVLNQNGNSSKVHEITEGRPLFIFQFAVLLAQKGDLNEVIGIDIKSSASAVRFLYDRIYDYLSPIAQSVFTAISLLVDQSDLSNVIAKLKFLLNMEDNQDEFEVAINELAKLKIIEIVDQKFFRVYSREILKIMNEYYQKQEPSYQARLTTKLSIIGKDKKLDNDNALLFDADSTRVTAPEGEVITKYRMIINRPQTSPLVKIQAILNLGAYLFSSRSNAQATLKLFADYKHSFDKSFVFIKNYAQYLWAADLDNSREEAISVINTYLRHRNDVTKEQSIQLKSLLAIYQSKLSIDGRERILEERRVGIIEPDDYKKQFSDQANMFVAITRYPGNVLIELLASGEIIDLQAGTRAEVLAALVQITEVFIRLNRYGQAKKICQDVVDKLPYNFHPPFTVKLKKMDMYLSKSRGRKSDYKQDKLADNPTKESDLALKMRDAINKKK
ncbi:NB-ARC domain-containing protein [Hymenobacter sp. AT01-02]|uniref:NB-ARC domain-containing protein n=1 Tax=Hymenobacter sp. AT01-02 TaxID=1571877 RepID=UPI0005F1143B|nr:NB-ARC domain-containing protein [Hymenobacter sp. AT01-02]